MPLCLSAWVDGKHLNIFGLLVGCELEAEGASLSKHYMLAADVGAVAAGCEAIEPLADCSVFCRTPLTESVSMGLKSQLLVLDIHVFCLTSELNRCC